MKKSKTTPTKKQQQGNIFDAFVKDMFSRIFFFGDFLRHYANQEFVNNIDLNSLQLANTHVFDKTGNENIADLIFECCIKDSDQGGEVVIVFEHASSDSNLLPLKLLGYLFGYWQRYIKDHKKLKPLPHPYFIVLRTGKRPLTKAKLLKDMVKLFPWMNEQWIPNFEFDIVDVPSIPFDQLVGAAPLRTVMGVLKKLTEGNEDDFAEALKAISEIEDTEERKELLVKSLQLTAKVFITKGKSFGTDKITKSLNNVFKGKEQDMLPTIFDELEAKGEARGRMEGLARAVLQVLTRRFRSPSASVEKKLFKIADLEKLSILLERAMYCESLKEFANSLK